MSAGRPGGPGRPVSGVLFDWGGTLTPFHTVDLLDLWLVAAQLLAPDRAGELAQALADAEAAWWRRAVADNRSGTTEEVLTAAAAATGLDLPAAVRTAALTAHLEAWTPHTITDPAAAPLLIALRKRGIRTGLLSNTHWPREWHERWLDRDGVLNLIDARTYTSDLAHLKPHPEAFVAALSAMGLSDPSRVVMVGDRPHDDISGAKALGMRAILLPNGQVPGWPVEPDATVAALDEVLPIVDRWNAEATE